MKEHPAEVDIFIMSTVSISQKQYAEFMKDSALLEALAAAGVDNWEGYDEAYAQAKSQIDYWERRK